MPYTASKICFSNSSFLSFRLHWKVKAGMCGSLSLMLTRQRSKVTPGTLPLLFNSTLIYWVLVKINVPFLFWLLQKQLRSSWENVFLLTSMSTHLSKCNVWGKKKQKKTVVVLWIDSFEGLTHGSPCIPANVNDLQEL